MIQTLLRFSVATFLLATLALGSATPASAQYMFLDTNGDGLNTAGDRLPFQESPTQFTMVDIWLETDRNQDGSPVTCATGEAVSLTSYEIALSSDGSVNYGVFTNLLPGFTSVQQVELASDFYAHFTSATPLSPGKHHLARIQAGAGTLPNSNLRIVTTGVFLSQVRTAFGSECGGLRVLGIHWFDTGDLEFGSIDHYPFFGPAALDMVVPAGTSATQAIEATDPDRASISVQVVSGPPYVSLETRVEESGSAVLRVHASPGFTDVGTASVLLQASDGAFTVTDQFQVTVTPPVNPAITINFETPSLGEAIRQVVDPYVDPTSGATFRALPSGSFQGVVGLIKNSATGCADPSDTNQRMGTAPQGTTAIGQAAHAIEVTFATPLQPPVWVSVDLKLGPTFAELRLFDASGQEVGATRDFAYPALPTCGPVNPRFAVVVGAGSDQPVASARFKGPNQVFTADDFRFAHGVATGAPLIMAPGNATAAEGALLSVAVSAFDPEGDPIALDENLAGLPLGNNAVFTKSPANTSGTLTWTPDFTHAGTYAVSFTATNGDGSASVTTSITVANTNRVPVAEAGGPYTGVVGIPISFSAAGSSDPDGDALTYLWFFGDGNTGMGSEVSHTYSAAGTFSVVVGVSDGTEVDQDGTSATIVPFLDARAFQSKPNRKIALSSGSSAVCIQLEPVAGAYANGDVDLSTLVMVSPGTGSVSQISAIADKSVLAGDTDQSGIEEIAACFTRRDLRLLFANVDGHVTVPVSLEARLVSGVTIHGELELNVTGTGGNLAASVYPNPLNPNATITFVTTREGAARVKLFSASGRLVRTLLDAPSLPAGYHDVDVDGLGESGSRLASGVYYYLIEAKEGNVRGRLAIVK